MRTEGVTLDHYDDRCETLKRIFPTLEQVPEEIKTAQYREKEKLANEDFALVANDDGHLMRKYACYDAGNTMMSVVYFMEHGHKLPEGAIKTAAANIMDACNRFGILPPLALIKAASSPSQNVVDITGQRPSVKTASFTPSSDQDFAVVMPDGRRLYPINNWDNMKLASDYWLRHEREFDPGIRRQYAVKLAARAEELDYRVPEKIKTAGARTWAEYDHIKTAMVLRQAVVHEEQRPFYDDLLDIAGDIGPEKFASALHKLDLETGAARSWPHIMDPYQATFGLQKQADSVIWEDGADRVTASELTNLALNHAGAMNATFTNDLVEGFAKDPITVFQSMPYPQKRIIGRLADNIAHSGKSEGQAFATQTEKLEKKDADVSREAAMGKLSSADRAGASKIMRLASK